MPKMVCYFQDSWQKMTSTIKKDSDNAFCQYCSQNIKVGNMDTSA